MRSRGSLIIDNYLGCLTRINGISRYYNIIIFVFRLYRSFKNIKWANIRVVSMFSTIFYEWR